MNGEPNAPELWLHAEDRDCFEQRVARLEWLVSRAPRGKGWTTFPGGWLSLQLFEEARYCFVYVYSPGGVLGDRDTNTISHNSVL